MEAYHKSNLFLQDAKKSARRRGYNPDLLELSDDGIHKLLYRSPQGLKRFGRLGYGDSNYYKRYEPDIAKQKTFVFRSSHKEISRIHNLGKYAPNELALAILW